MRRAGPVKRILIVAGLGVTLLSAAAAFTPAAACQTIGIIRYGDCPPPQSQPSDPQAAARSAEKALLRAINRERADRDLRTVATDRRAVSMAREHARAMERRGTIYHNPALGTKAGQRALGNPTVVGENVGVGRSAASIHRAFMKSRGHRGVILGPRYRLAGIGVYADGEGELWVVELLLSRSHATADSSTRAAAKHHSTSGTPDAPAISTPEPILHRAARHPAAPHAASVVRVPSRSIPVSLQESGWVSKTIALVLGGMAVLGARRVRRVRSIRRARSVGATDPIRV